MSRKNNTDKAQSVPNPQKFRWKQKSQYKTYKNANAKRNSLIEAGEKYVKVRRCGPAGTQYKVVVGTPLEKKNTKSEKGKEKKKDESK